MSDPTLAEICSKAQDISLNITTDLLRFLHQLQISPSAESLKTLEERTVRIRDFRSHIDTSFFNLAEHCVRIHNLAPNADAECSNILANLHGAPSSGSLVDRTPVFDQCLNEYRENTVEYFTLKAEIDLVNREIGQLISDFRNILVVVDTSENTSHQAIDLQM